MARVFAYERHEFRLFNRKRVINQGEVIELDDDIAAKQVASHPEKLMILEAGEAPPVLTDVNESRTTVILRPDYDRAMLPGRLSPQKKRQLKAAKKRSRHARLVVSE
jgi:hypothetical protein